jgi:sodium-dependent dicarboxylate transporter 2/3/5
MPMPALTPPAHTLAAIMAWVICYWMTEAVPLAATAFLGPVLCVLLGVGKDKVVYAQFAHPLIMQFIGTFMLAAAMEKYGLDRRMASHLTALPWVTRSPGRLFVALAVLTAFLSMWMSNAATTAMMVPIALGALSVWPQVKANPLSRGSLVLLIAFAASVGGQGTPVGTPPNLIGLGFIRTTLGAEISFVQWMMLGVPLVVVQLSFLLWWMHPRWAKGSPEIAGTAASELAAQRRALGPLSRGEINTIGVFCVVVLLWIAPGLLDIASQVWPAQTWAQSLAKQLKASFPEETVGLLAGVLLMVLPTSFRRGTLTLPWREAVRIDWGTIFMFAGGMALGAQLFDTGLARVLGESVAGSIGQPKVWTLTAVGIVLSIIVSEAASNTASATVMVPVMIAVAQGANVDALPVALATCLACSFGFLLPVSTGPNAIAYGTGHVPVGLMMRRGALLDLVGAITIFLLVWWIVPLMR